VQRHPAHGATPEAAAGRREAAAEAIDLLRVARRDAIADDHQAELAGVFELVQDHVLHGVAEQDSRVGAVEIVGWAFVLDQRVGPQVVEDAVQPLGRARRPVDEAYDHDVDPLWQAAEQELGEELPARGQEALEHQHQQRVPEDVGLRVAGLRHQRR
jgi:hypothetical protein